MGPDCTRWWIQHGGRAPRARGLFEHASGWPGAPTVKILLDHFGVEWFKDSGTLQLAVTNHDFESVKMLAEAGADLNEWVEDWQMDERERRAAPLPALLEALYAKSETMIRYLAGRGAKTTRKYLHIDDPFYTFPEELKVLADLIVELGAVKEDTAM
ncbi:hypothetical protein FB567DRAFT_447884 [Paraphoma chrysanthemicola]|uniref:Uncharacterized protein n=1 Tax=Paraphoma chrysanthemicola TaxID=798071 RepID=A0A8K0R3W0_9PLEO|nr:hypothetical protein FB567DRAFT_447884 [Paraphoma chrysanthemicola]